MNRTAPAFPFIGTVRSQHVYQQGLTKREHFAGVALQGLLANPAHAGFNVEEVAWEAVRLADALCDALAGVK